MGRIRTIKPSFFRHELLQDLEKDNPGLHIMLVFAGLWSVCDSKGRFEYKPRSLKLDILPFLEFDFERTLMILKINGFIVTYQVGGVNYAYIPTWEEHQRITGKEKESGEKFPEPPVKSDVNQQGNNWETPSIEQGKHPDVQEGKGYIGKGKDILSPEPVKHLPENSEVIQEKKEPVSGEEILGPAKKSRKKALVDAVAPHPFRQSKVFEFTEFEKSFTGTDYEKANLKYYYNRVLNWSDSNTTKNRRTDWVAVARNFMLSDSADSKLRMNDGTISNDHFLQPLLKIKKEFGKV